MLRQIYTAASGMITALRRVDTAAHNIANLNTTGFKSSRIALTAFFGLGEHTAADLAGGRLDLGGDIATGVTASSHRRFVQGPLTPRPGEPTALAIDGPGYFTVEGESGEVLLTRDGNFRVSAAGRLESASGRTVLSSGGQPIEVTDPATGLPYTDLRIDDQGVLYASDGTVIAQVGLVDADTEQLVSAGENLFRVPEGGEMAPVDPAQTRVLQYTLEASATDLATELTETMLAQRHFGLNQRVLRTADEVLGTLVDKARAGG